MRLGALAAGGGLMRVLRDGCVDLFVTSQGKVMVAGPATTFFELAADNGCMLAGLRLRLGAAAAVLGHPASEFRNTEPNSIQCWASLDPE